jgi:hypothetical protein
MVLIVEDGTGVAGANSYATAATVRAYAAARGVVLPATDPALEPLVLVGMDYLEGLRSRFQGTKTDPAQALQWPRYGVVIDGTDYSADAIPPELIGALSRLCMAQSEGANLAPTGTGGFVVEETVGPITTKYSDKHGGGPGSLPDIPAVDTLLSPLFSVGKTGGLFQTVRV